jgi:hypothetical protein
MKFRATDIEWDTDGEDVDLPSEDIVEADSADEVADALSDKHGFCIRSLDVKEI